MNIPYVCVGHIDEKLREPLIEAQIHTAFGLVQLVLPSRALFFIRTTS